MKPTLKITLKTDPLESSLFENKKDIEDFLCTICGDVPNPKTAIEDITCGHIFCKYCFNQWIDIRSANIFLKLICPFCRGSISNNIRVIATDNKFVYSLLMNMKVRCPTLCSWSGLWSELDNHLSECEDAVLPCKYKCGHKNYRKFIGEHETNECQNKPTECSFCGTKVRQKNLQKHLENCKTNDKTVLPCKYEYLGCKFTGKKSERVAHEETNDEMHLKLAINFIETHKNSKKRVYTFGSLYKVNTHDHPLKYINQNNDWACDGKNLPGGCKSGITGFGQTRGMKQFRCYDCDYDLCIKCLEHYMVD